MALLQEVKKGTSTETDRLFKQENNETSSSSISDESKAGVADGTCAESASNTDGICAESASNTDGTCAESVINTDGTCAESASNTDGTCAESAINTDGTRAESSSNTDGTGTESASITDLDDESSDENRERERTKASNDPQIKEKQLIFLKKHFDELNKRKLRPNWYKRFGERTSLKPLKFEELPCQCHIEKECRISENTNEEKEQLTRQEPTTAQSNVSTKSQTHPLAGHNSTCNLKRLDKYFRVIVEYFTEVDSHPHLFLLDPNRSVNYKQKALREIRKITVLKMRHGLEDALEEWEDTMNDNDVEKWKKRNKIREYLHFILEDMLKSLIGPNEDLTEREDIPDDDADNSAQSSSRRIPQIDPEKLRYQMFKKKCEEYEVELRIFCEKRQHLTQEVVLAGLYPEIMEERRIQREMFNELLASSTDVSSEESERETE